MKMSDLHIELTADTSAVERKARIISKRLAAMADELDLAEGLEPVKCAYCGKTIRPSDPHWCDVNLNGAYCSQGCMEMAGMEQAFPLRSGCGARWPSGTWGQSCLGHCTCIDKVVDTVILRLRDNFGLEV